MTDTKTLSLTDRIIAYEQGELSEEEVLALFQALIDNGMAWTLQGHYGRTAVALIMDGLCVATTDKAKFFASR